MFGSPDRELSNDFLVVVVHRRKVELHTSSHLTPIEVGRSAVSARLALFCGRLMDLKECTSGVAWSKGRQNLESNATHPL